MIIYFVYFLFLFIMVQLKYLFGKPNEGIHKYRVCNIAIFDYLIVLIICMLITCVSGYPIEIVTIFVLLLGIILHYSLGLNTNTTKYINKLM